MQLELSGGDAGRWGAPRAAVGSPWALAELAGDQSSLLAEGARELRPVVITLGPGLEGEVRTLMGAGRLHDAFQLDEKGNSLLAAAAVEAARRLDGAWLSPGCHGLPLSLIPRIAMDAGAAEVGVSVLTSGMLQPEKSIAGLVAVGGRLPSGCRTCASRICPWRGTGVEGCG